MSTIACAAVLASCGEGSSSEDEGSIPPQTAAGILTKLDDVETQFDNGECEAATVSAAQVQAAIAALGSNVKGDLEEALVEASDNLVRLVRDDCEPAEAPIDTGATGPDGVEGG